MCGILAILGIADGRDAMSLKDKALALSKRQRHRGPDWSGVYAEGDVILAHERLTIVDVTTGAQPLYSTDGNLVLVVNGEIYNHETIRASMPGVKFMSKSDCEVIIQLFERSKGDVQFVDELRGMFGFVLYDRQTGRYIAARDPIGIIPLYYGWAEDGSIWFSSEMKALCDSCVGFQQFPPGHIYDSSLPEGKRFRPYYKPSWRISSGLTNGVAERGEIQAAESLLRESLIEAVESHLMADVPFGVLLSGGLDSSLISSIAYRLLQKQPGSGKLRSFSIGLEGSQDLAAAKKVAKFLGTDHSEFTFTVQEGLDALSDVIYHLETFDLTTVRASTPMFLMSRRIKASGIKMVLSGEGSDEIFGGYLYFHKAPNAQEFQDELHDKIATLHKYDCLRANKSMAAFGVEVRVPFLDTKFLEAAMTIHPKFKMAKDEVSGQPRIEKHILRKAFTDPNDPFLPDEVLWRQKEQFSDGVGYNWIDSLKAYSDKFVSQEMMDTAAITFPDKTPLTKEAYLYRQIFERHYPQQSARDTVPWEPTIACSTPRAMSWDAAFKKMADPSGRCVIGVHTDAYSSGEISSSAMHSEGSNGCV